MLVIIDELYVYTYATQIYIHDQASFSLKMKLYQNKHTYVAKCLHEMRINGWASSASTA